MPSEGTFKPKSSKRSLTDRILALCASGRFGVREAIAAALKRSASGRDRLDGSKLVKSKGGAGDNATAAGVRMRTLLLTLVLFSLPGIVLAQEAAPVQYSADEVTGSGKNLRTSKVYVWDDKMRTEVTMGPLQVVTIVRLDEKIVYVMLPVQKLFVEKPLVEEDGLLARVSDKNTKRELVGTETVQAQPCDKYKVAVKDRVFYFWVNKSTQTPVQILSTDNLTRIEWKNVQVGPQPADLFKPPMDYQKFTGVPVTQQQ